MYVFEEMVERIHQLKSEKNIKSKELATLSDVPIGTLGKILRMETKDPQVGSIIKIAQALGVSADFLVYGEDLPSKEDTIVPTTPNTSNEYVLLENFKHLNTEGQEKAMEYVSDLVVLGRYTKNNTTTTEPKSHSEPTEVPNKKRHWAEEMAEEMDVEAETEQYRQRLIEMKKAKERSSVLKSLEKNA